MLSDLKITIEERTSAVGCEVEYEEVSEEQRNQMMKIKPDRVVLYVPNRCGGETRVTIYGPVSDAGAVSKGHRDRLH